MHITLTLILEEDELIWLDKVREAYNLVPMQPYMRDVTQNPFDNILSNRFMIDDVYAAKDALEVACEKQIAPYKNTESEFGRVVVLKCEQAKRQFTEFFDFCCTETGGSDEELAL